jgi:hypothetical protein
MSVEACSWSLSAQFSEWRACTKASRHSRNVPNLRQLDEQLRPEIGLDSIAGRCG